MQLFKGDLLFVLLPFVLRKLGCASAAEVTMADRSGEWGIEKGDCASNNHPHEKSFSAFQNKSNNRPVAMATTALFKDETRDLCLINTSPSLLFPSLLTSLSLMKEADQSSAGLNDGLMDVRLKPPCTLVITASTWPHLSLRQQILLLICPALLSPWELCECGCVYRTV